MKKRLLSVLILLPLIISACNGNNSKEKPIVDNSGFKNINDTEPFEIHTDEQKTFLEYTGSYAKMDKSLFPNGKSHLSDSKPIELTWNYDLPAGKEVAKYSVKFGQEKDLSDGYTVESTEKEDKISFYNPYLGRNYYQLTATFTDGSTDQTPIRHFEVNSTYPRNLTIAGMTNCRDIGGRTLADGGRIKQGLIYRTSGKNQNGSLTAATTEEMVGHLKVKNEINLADSTSYNLKLDGVPVNADCMMDTSSTGGYSHISRNTEAVKNFFDFIADENNYPVFYHCKIGTDRTGVCTILLTGLLGVSYNEIYQDYLFSNFGKIGEQRTIGDGNSHDIRKYMDDFLKYSGEKFQNKVYNVLLGIGVSKENLDKIINNLTEGTPAKGNDAGQIIGTGNLLVGNGVTVSTTTVVDKKNPENYFVLDSDSKSVSYTFEAKKAYTGQVIAYLGNPDASTSKKIADAISCSLDNNAIQMLDQTYYDARMGKCTVSGSSRTNYWPVILGTVDLAKGNHTLTITGSSNSMNLAGIYIFDNATAGGTNGFED